MNYLKTFKVPFGMQDYLTNECYNKNEIEEVISNEFKKWGYEKIETTPVEYYDNFVFQDAPIDQKTMFKMTDFDGNIVVLKPDATLPIARVVATKMDSDTLPIKVQYLTNVFNAQRGTSSRRVLTQAGVEFLGDGGAENDIEVIALAINVLKNVGLCDFKIDIGQVDFFKGLMQEFEIDELLSEEIRKVVDKKNVFGVEMLLKDNKNSEKAIKAIKKLTSLFGGDEVLNEAKKICNNEISKKAIENLKSIYESLKSIGFEKYITIDLGLVQGISYYTGVVFRGLTKNVGSPILTGGRYDNLAKSFGKDIKATGFAVDIKKLLVSLENEGSLKCKPALDVVIMSLASDAFTYKYICKLRNQGKNVSKISQTKSGFGKKQLQEYAEKIGACEAIFLSKDEVSEITVIKGGKNGKL